MSEHSATIRWERETEDFRLETYSRTHTITYAGGITVKASAAPNYKGDPSLVNPEEAFVASLSSCHMLTFLALAAKAGFAVAAYEDEAVGTMIKAENNVRWISEVTLRPKITFAGPDRPDPERLRQLHDSAHHHCFIANSVKTAITVTARRP